MCRFSDTRTTILRRLRLRHATTYSIYCSKDNGVNILKSIDEGPFQMGTTRVIVAEGTKGSLNLGPERPRVYSDLSQDEKDRFVTAVKLNKGLKDSNFDQLYAYLKQHEAHANDNKMMLERLTQQTVDPLALMSNVSPQHYHSQSSTNPPTTYHQTHSADTSQSDLGISPTDNLIENLTNTLALLTQVVVQNVQGRQNRGQGNNARGAGVVGYGGARNKVGNANLGQARVVLNEEQLLFLAGRQDNAIDEDTDDCDAYDFDVDEAPTAQTMFMANLSSADLVYDEADPSYDSNVLSEVQDHDHYQDVVCDHHQEHEMHNDVQPKHIVDSHADYTSDSHMTPYDQYVKDNAMPVVQNNASMVPNDVYVMIDNDVHEFDVLSVSHTPRNTVVNNSDNSLNDEMQYTRNKLNVMKEVPDHLEGLFQKAYKEVKEMSDAFDELEAELDQSIVDRKHDEIERKDTFLLNMII
ncbi:hypothetical protein Tco_0494008 [Tanacetum coccineum]